MPNVSYYTHEFFSPPHEQCDIFFPEKPDDIQSDTCSAQIIQQRIVIHSVEGLPTTLQDCHDSGVGHRWFLKKNFAKFEKVKVRKNIFTETSIGIVTGLMQCENT